MTNSVIIFRHKRCPNCLSKLNTRPTWTRGMMMDASEHFCPKCGKFTHWSRTDDITFENKAIVRINGNSENNLISNNIFNKEYSLIIDQSMIAGQLMSDIRKYRSEHNITTAADCDVTGFVEFFESMFDDIVVKEGKDSNVMIKNIMSLLCSDDFLDATGNNTDTRHVILDSYLLAICKLYSDDLDLVEMFNNANKYYS